MKASKSLQVTEIGISDGQFYQIPLADIRRHPVTIGRAPSSPDHYQIGVGSPTQNAISSYHATIYAVENIKSPRGWDYFVRDGVRTGAGWKESQQGIWIGKELVEEVELRPSAGGHVTIFPKIDGHAYHCILEWPAELEPGDDTNPTLQNLHKAQMKARVFAQQAAQTKEQLLDLGKNMVSMRASFEHDRKNMELNNARLIKMIGELQSEIEQRKRVDAEQNKANKRQQACIVGIGIILTAFGLTVLGLDSERMAEIFEVSMVFATLALTWFGGSKLIEK